MLSQAERLRLRLTIGATMVKELQVFSLEIVYLELALSSRLRHFTEFSKKY